MFSYYLSHLPQLLTGVAAATVLLSILQFFLCRKDADRGIPLPLLCGCLSLLPLLLAMRFNRSGAYTYTASSGVSWDMAAVGKLLLTALLLLLVFNIPTLALSLIYRAARKREEREYLDSLKKK